MTRITTHVLDLTLGRPAGGLAVSLQQRLATGAYEEIATGVTNQDGRISDLISPDRVAAGTYQLRFETEAYLRQAGQSEVFYPSVTIEFRVASASSHYHVPLLLSPFGYSTYRGS
jgi:5-hydroxyisourate hydrolase